MNHLIVKDYCHPVTPQERYVGCHPLNPIFAYHSLGCCHVILSINVCAEAWLYKVHKYIWHKYLNLQKKNNFRICLIVIIKPT